jgi:haloacetate dehalogenase
MCFWPSRPLAAPADPRPVSFEGFDQALLDVGPARIFVRWAGSGPPLLLLHGFPETHLMWRDVATLLCRDFTVVCADLRGYGQSSCPASTPDHGPYGQRAMAGDLVQIMERLGFARWRVAGHDRGGRVAYRAALDHPDRVERLAVLDIVPTSLAFDRAEARFALDYWPWSLLAQPSPLPERFLTAAADAVVDHALAEWGPAAIVPPEIRAAYVRALADPAHAHAICEEYRAASTLDREHERADRAAGRRIGCPVLALWSAGGALDTWYGAEGGPLGLWKTLADEVEGRAVDGGHFFPEARPRETAAALTRFFAG